MKWIIATMALSLFALCTPASAQTSKPDVSAAPSAQNSGAGIAGQPGNKNGPAVKPGETVGSDQHNPTVSSQDASKVQGLPGNKSGPPAKKPSDQR
jgi:hypothetical protein